jgi:hypothetical protein
MCRNGPDGESAHPEAVSTECLANWSLRTIPGLERWRGNTRTRGPLLPPPQTRGVHVRASRELRRNEFTQQALEVASSNGKGRIQEAVCYSAAGNGDEARGLREEGTGPDVKWVNALAERNGVNSRPTDPLQGLQRTFAARTLIARRFMKRGGLCAHGSPNTSLECWRVHSSERLRLEGSCLLWRRVFVKERGKRPHFAVACPNPDGEGPRPMLVSPSLLSGKQLFAE